MSNENELNALANALENSQFEIIAKPLQLDLIEAINAISYKPAKEDALVILPDITFQFSSRKYVHSKDQGLMKCVRLANYYQSSWRNIKPKGPRAVGDELDDLRSAMLEVAGRLNTLSDSARRWIDLIPARDEGNPNPDDVHEDYQLWLGCDAGEAFTSPDLAKRLSNMAAILEHLSNEAKGIVSKSPGTKSLFSPPPVDLNLFDECAKLLKARGRNLANLRIIASALYQFVTKKEPTATWAERQEEDARRKYGTHPPKIS